jgi:hypothetical protein
MARQGRYKLLKLTSPSSIASTTAIDVDCAGFNATERAELGWSLQLLRGGYYGLGRQPHLVRYVYVRVVFSFVDRKIKERRFKHRYLYNPLRSTFKCLYKSPPTVREQLRVMVLQPSVKCQNFVFHTIFDPLKRSAEWPRFK